MANTELQTGTANQFANTPEGKRVIRQPDGRYLATDGSIQSNFGIAAMRSRTPEEVAAYRAKDVSDELYRQSANAKADTFLSRNISKWVDNIPAAYGALVTAGAMGAFDPSAAAGAVGSGGGTTGMMTGGNSIAALTPEAVAAGGTTTATSMASGIAPTLGGLAPIQVAGGGLLTGATNGLLADGAATNGLLADGTIDGGIQIAGQTGKATTAAATTGTSAFTPLNATQLGTATGIPNLTSQLPNVANTPANYDQYGKLIQSGVGLLGSNLNSQAINGQVSEQNRLNTANVKDNREYLDKQNKEYQGYLSGIDTTQRNRSAEANAVVNNIRDSQLTPAQKALYSSQIDASQAGLLSQAGLGNLAAKYDANARNTQAGSLSAAARKAAAMATFKPYGITTRFGKSDETGNYKLTDDIKAQQDALMGTSEGLLKQFQGSQAATAPMGDSAQSMFKLGNSYLGLNAQEQATKWMTEQQALLDPSRSAELASVNSRLAAQGRSGLSMGGSAGMMSSNPELAAYYNAKRMQDMSLSSQAMQQGMNYGTYGANMVGQGAKTLQDMYATQSAAYNPYQTAIGGANELEKLGQNALTIGTDLGVKRAAAGANAGQLYLSGASQAANAAYAGAANPNQYADYYAMQQAGINEQTGLQKIVGNNQANLNNAQSTYDFASPQAAGLAAAATKIPYAAPGQNALNPNGQYANPANSMGGNFLTGLANNGTNWGQVANTASGLFNNWFGGSVP